MTKPAEPLDARMVAFIRTVLAFCTFIFTYIDPTAPPTLIPVVYTALALYCLYSVAIYRAAARGAAFVSSGLVHGLDIVWYLLLVALSGGSNSAYFLLFFFAVLVASFSSGVSSGLRAAAISAALFTLVGYSAIAPNEFQLSRFLLRPVYLLVLGYMIAYWGGRELRLRRQLELLRDVTVTLNPRFGTHHLIGHVVKVLRDFYKARVCLLLLVEEGGDSCLLFRAEAGVGGGAAPAERVPAEAVRDLLPYGGSSVLVCSGARRRLFRRGGCDSFDLETKEQAGAPPDVFDSVSRALAADNFLSVPVTYQRGVTGRLYVADSARSLGRGDADFIAQVFEHTRPFIENVRLVDTLASDAAQDERQKIALDIHDGVIQPYIGLQLGLEALRRQADGSNEAVSKGIERLIALTESGIEDLRLYVGGLKAGGERKGSLLPALRRFGVKFSEATGVGVEVESETPDLFLNDRLAGEVFQMTTEALSNIRRHSEAKAATVRIGCDDRRLSLRVTNDGPPGDTNTTAVAFVPRSITERASSLGGTVFVRRPPEGGAVVEIDIPL
ncbi:MAG TPA: histidine kinase [Pyrinomonadaceae bacterium]